MKKQIVLLTSAGAAPTLELVESLSAAGIGVRLESLNDPHEMAFCFPDEDSLHFEPIAVLYELPPEARPDNLRSVVELAGARWPEVPVVACRRLSAKSSVSLSSHRNPALKRIGFRAIADRVAQLPALLRQVEEGASTGELRLPPDFKSPLDSQALSLPASVRREHLRGALALLASLHQASNQKEAAQAAVAGVARLVTANRWMIFICSRTDVIDSLRYEPLAARSAGEDECLSFDEEWCRELLRDPEIPDERESKSARAAATKVETIKKIESGRRVIAVPLISGERVVGVLEGVRSGARLRQFSATESSLLTALAISIASALANSVRIAEAERLSLTDDLTKLHNARYLRQFLVNEIKRARRYGSSVAALFLDLDDFKLVNDLHGHLVGSHVLMEVASSILPSVRDTDCVVRYGGDEFVVILPETGVDEAVQVADRIRLKIECQRFTGGRGLKVSLTASFGVAVFPQHASSPQQLIACADTAMYAAKAARKNCVQVITGPPVTTIRDYASQTPVGASQFQRFPDEKLIS